MPVLDHRQLKLGQRPAELPAPPARSAWRRPQGNMINTREMAGCSAPGTGKPRNRGDVDTDVLTALFVSDPRRGGRDAAGTHRPARWPKGHIVVFIGRADPCTTARDPQASGLSCSAAWTTGWVVASETAPRWPIVGARFVRESEPASCLHRRARGEVPDLRLRRSREDALLLFESSTWRDGHPRSPDGGAATGSQVGRQLPSSISGRRPGHHGPESGRPREDRLREGQRHPFGRDWSGTPTWAGPLIKPSPDPSGEKKNGESS